MIVNFFIECSFNCKLDLVWLKDLLVILDVVKFALKIVKIVINSVNFYYFWNKIHFTFKVNLIVKIISDVLKFTVKIVSIVTIAGNFYYFQSKIPFQSLK